MGKADVKGVLTLVVPLDLMAELTAEAEAEGLTRSAHVRRIIASRMRSSRTEFGQALADSVRGPK